MVCIDTLSAELWHAILSCHTRQCSDRATLLDTFQTSVTSFRWQKWLTESSQIITVSVTGQIHGCPYNYHSSASKHQAPFPTSTHSRTHAHSLTHTHTHSHESLCSTFVVVEPVKQTNSQYIWLTADSASNACLSYPVRYRKLQAQLNPAAPHLGQCGGRKDQAVHRNALVEVAGHSHTCSCSHRLPVCLYQDLGNDTNSNKIIKIWWCTFDILVWIKMTLWVWQCKPLTDTWSWTDWRRWARSNCWTTLTLFCLHSPLLCWPETAVLLQWNHRNYDVAMKSQERIVVSSIPHFRTIFNKRLLFYFYFFKAERRFTALI